MRCTSCGEEITGQPKFCPNCGTQLMPGASYSSLSDARYTTMDSSELVNSAQSTPPSMSMRSPVVESTGSAAAPAQVQAPKKPFPVKIVAIAAAAVVLIAAAVLLIPRLFGSKEVGPQYGVYQSEAGTSKTELVVNGRSVSINTYVGDALQQRRQGHLHEDGRITVSHILDYDADGTVINARDARNEKGADYNFGTATFTGDGSSMTVTLNPSGEKVDYKKYGVSDGKAEWNEAVKDFQEAAAAAEGEGAE